MFGPTLGFLLGSFCASLWVDIGVVDVGKRPWGGALADRSAGTCMLTSTFPVYFSKKGGSLESFSYSKAGINYILISAACSVTGIALDARPLCLLQKHFV